MTVGIITIKQAEDRFEIFTPFHLKDVAKMLPDRRAEWDDNKFRCWSVPATQTHAEAVEDAFTGHPMSAGKFFTDLVDHRRESTENKLIEELLGGKVTPEQVKALGYALTLSDPWDHQRIGFNLIIGREFTALDYDMGTGKSKIVCDVVTATRPPFVLIACPKAVVDVWPIQFERHCQAFRDGDVDVISIADFNGTVAAKTEKIEKEMNKSRADSTVLIVNYDSAWRSSLARFLLSKEWDLGVCDEIHRIKSATGKASKFFGTKLAPKCRRRVGLSGTMLPHSPMDAFGVYRFLNWRLFGRSFTQFRSRYAILVDRQQYKMIVGYRNCDEMNRIIFSCTHRVKKRDVLDLPPVTHVRIPVKISKKARRVHDELKTEFIAGVNGGIIDASNALVKLLRLQQVTSGFAVAEDPETGEEIVSRVCKAKEEALQELAEDITITDPITVFSRFTHDVQSARRVGEATGRGSFELSGQENTLDEWQQSTGGEILSAQIQSGSEGVDMTRACYQVYLSPGLSLGTFDQSLARVDRPGQERPVTVYHLVAENTIDERIYEMLDQKRVIVDAILTMTQEGDL